MTFQECLQAEPRLYALAQKTSLYTGRVNWHEWEGIKSQLKRFVGMYAEQEKLATSEAYDTVYQGLWNIYGRGK